MFFHRTFQLKLKSLHLAYPEYEAILIGLHIFLYKYNT